MKSTRSSFSRLTSSSIVVSFAEKLFFGASWPSAWSGDLLSAFGDADWMVHGDGVHANDLGHRVVANAVFQVLAANCSGLALETKEMEKNIAPWRDESTLQQ